ncbi:MAG: hypothetical protein R2838_14290 [Caldilineaceae bacterium]
MRIHTDDGLIGLGRFYVPRAISAMVHDVFANLLLGRSAFDIESHWRHVLHGQLLRLRRQRSAPSAQWTSRCGTCWGSTQPSPSTTCWADAAAGSIWITQHLRGPRPAPGLPALGGRPRRSGRRTAEPGSRP